MSSAWSSGRPRLSIQSAARRCFSARSGAGDLAVGDVADERVGEGELGSRPRRTCASASARIPCARGHAGWRRPPAVPTERPAPEDLAHDCCVPEELLLAFREAVQPCRDDPLQRLREGELVGRSPLEVELGELLRVEGVAARALEQRLLRVGGEHGLLEALRDEARSLLVGECRERERRRVQLAATPAGAALEELGTGGSDDEEWHVRDPFHELVHEVEERLVGPVQVLEHEDERAQLGHRLEEVAPGRERLGAPVSAELALACEADESQEVRLDPATHPRRS